MGTVLEKLYARVAGPSLFEIIPAYSIEVSWGIEAGCHDGSDSLLMIEKLGLEKLYAFEPDAEARAKAETLLFPKYTDVVELSPKGLSSSDGMAQLEDNGNPGGGISQVVKTVKSNAPEKLIHLIRLDDLGVFQNFRGGLLWLDVEGHATEVLKGARETLLSITIAKIEVQLHDMGFGRAKDAFQVVSILKTAGLIPIYLPIHPGYFGDIIFVRKTNLSHFLILKSQLKVLLFTSLHNYIYPLLKKPRS
jgi:FkbM family methyltransferase